MGPHRLNVSHTLTVLNIYTLLTRYVGYNLASLIWIHCVFQNINERAYLTILQLLELTVLAVEIFFPMQQYYVYCTNQVTSYLV
jgi:hypothetical protein